MSAHQLSLLDPRTISRRTDPATSRQAAREVTASGARAKQQIACMELVRDNPGQTSAELAQHSVGTLIELDRYALARRLPEVERAGMVRRGESRKCTATGRQAITWWPPAHPGAH